MSVAASLAAKVLALAPTAGQEIGRDYHYRASGELIEMLCRNCNSWEDGDCLNPDSPCSRPAATFCCKHWRPAEA